jgi:gliding motility-associated-like protein
MFLFDSLNYAYPKKGFLIILLIIMFFCCRNEIAAQNQPQPPELDSISITADGYPIISWFLNQEPIESYTVLRGRFDPIFPDVPIWDEISTLSSTTTSFIDDEVSACSEMRFYKVFASNSVGDSWSENELRTIYLEEPVMDMCANSIFLQWTGYVNMVSELLGYQIFVSENDGDFYLLATVDANQTNFAHDDPSPGISYSYKIRAINEDGSRNSTSCSQSIVSQTYQKPSFAYLRFATVENNSYVRLEWITDNAPVSKFEVLRSEDGINYTMINQIEDLVTYSPAGFFDDNTADFNTRSFYYRINVFDSCGITLFNTGNLTRTIHLAGAPGFGYVNNLTWNEYSGWALGIKTYKVWRQIESDPSSLSMIAELPAGTTSYQDDVSALGNVDGGFVYNIEAIENDGDNGFEDIIDNSLSNKVTISQESSVLLPNAFMPGSMPPDDEFCPFVSFIEQEGYEMAIFNKWGQQIFISRQISAGWDGKYNGEYVPAGAYVYVIKFRNAAGRFEELRGTVTVLR